MALYFLAQVRVISKKEKRQIKMWEYRDGLKSKEIRPGWGRHAKHGIAEANMCTYRLHHTSTILPHICRIVKQFSPPQ